MLLKPSLIHQESSFQCVIFGLDQQITYTHPSALRVVGDIPSFFKKSPIFEFFTNNLDTNILNNQINDNTNSDSNNTNINRINPNNTNTTSGNYKGKGRRIREVEMNKYFDIRCLFVRMTLSFESNNLYFPIYVCDGIFSFFLLF